METNRLTGITTRGGDEGMTSLASGFRMSKSHGTFYAIGDVDELNSQLGLVIAHVSNPYITQILTKIQNHLFNVGGELAGGKPTIDATHVAFLDQHIADWNANLPPLKEFVLPGGNIAAATCHVARSVCRRAERNCVALQVSTWPYLLQYINRLSDFLFILARVLARRSGANEMIWRP